MDLCSGGMIWSCCVDEEVHPASNPNQGAIKNASKIRCPLTFGSLSEFITVILQQPSQQNEEEYGVETDTIQLKHLPIC